jgi:UDP-N-acetylmuramoylalanine--D-glutamate ligase
MKVAIIGYAVEGQSAVKYWQAKGDDVTICNRSADRILPDGVNKQVGTAYLKDLDRFDIIVRSPGIHPKIILEQNPTIGPKITTVVDEFLRVCPTKNVIGVTGTKGKGTTSILIAKMLEASNKHVFLGGNYGIPPLDFLPELTEDSWVVLELSSFMLYDIKHSPHISVCLMVVPEHLDWHPDAADYFKAKGNLFTHQQPDDIAIYFADNGTSHQIASNSPGRKIAYYAVPGAYVKDGKIMIDETVICDTNELKLLGKHNWENACAAATALWQIVQDAAPIRSVLTSFSGLEHRLEFVREVDGVKYYDDSFGTTPETAQVAIEAFAEPKVVILGGSDKGSSYDDLAQTVKQGNVRKAVVIGQMAEKITMALHKIGFTDIVSGGNSMEEIVATCRTEAKAGDIVLLSTACASFGMFTNYKDRGNQFKKVVSSLI